MPLPEGCKQCLVKVSFVPQRIVFATMGFFAVVNAYIMRVCLSVAITVMVVKVHKNETETDDGNLYCPKPDDYKYPIGPQDEKYHWSESQQGLILSAFYWGYIITHLPGALIAEKFGGKWVLTIGILSTAVCTLLTPLAIVLGGPYALIALRVIMGLGEGTTFPAISVLIAAWIPKTERAKLGTLVFGGVQIGTVLGTALSGVIIFYFDAWQAVFYIFGIAAVVWSVLFIIFCYSEPESHPFISDKEKEVLLAQMGRLERDKDLKVPWKEMFKSPPILALIFAQIGHDWGLYIMVSDLPKYMSDVLHFSIKSNGFYSALPYLVMWCFALSASALCDWLINKEHLSTTVARKLFTTIAAIGPAIFTVAASYAGCERAVVVALFTIGMGLMGTYYPGMRVNGFDLSPNYAGTIMAIVNGLGSITGTIVPYFVGLMTPNTSLTEWRIVFWVGFAVFTVSATVYIIWGTGERQPWDSGPEKTEK